MVRKSFNVFILIMVGSLLLGCAAPQMQSTGPLFKPYQLTTDQYEPKVETFVVVLDASSSMSETYNGTSKFTIAMDFLGAMNKTIPDLNINGALRTFGHHSDVSKEKTTSIYGLTQYSSDGFESALQKVAKAGGTSPLDVAIIGASKDLASAEGKIAVIVVSDGKDMGNAPVVAANNLKNQFGDRICIYTVLVGDNQTGKKLLENIAGAGKCGYSSQADGFKSGSDMANFVKQVFLTQLLDSDGDGVLDKFDQCPNTPQGVKVDAKGCPLDSDGDGVADYLDKCPSTPAGVTVDKKGCPLDSDGDGVIDIEDQCPGTPKGAKVNAQGCWILGGVVFDTGKSNIKPNFYPELNAIATTMNNNPGLKVEVQGHTDSVGRAASNMKLSENRARAVMEYLVSKGIDAKRLSAKGLGEARPIATNDTSEGRAQNRRVELKPIK
jgi:OOP family OmpA-OmpF porin